MNGSLEQNNEAFEVFFELPETRDELKKRDAIKLKKLNKKERYGFEREKRELKQKEKNHEKLAKFFKQAEQAEAVQKRAEINQIVQNLLADAKQGAQIVVSNVQKGAQNMVSEFERGINRKSARLQQGLARASARLPKNGQPNVRYKDLVNESSSTVACSTADSPPKNELRPENR